MDRRTVLAIILILLVATVPSILFPPKRVDRPAGAPADTSSVARSDTGPSAAVPPALAGPRPAGPATRRADEVPERIVTVESPLYRYSFSTRGARLVGATLKQYRSFVPGETGPAQIIPDSSEFLAYAVAVGADTLRLADWSFEPSSDSLDLESGTTDLTWTGRRGNATVTLRYHFTPDNYLFEVSGDARGAGVRSGLVLVKLGPGIRQVEADSMADYASHSVVVKARSTEKINFSSLDPGERRTIEGPLEWVAMKSKYFLVAILSAEEGAPQIGGVTAVGGPRSGKVANKVHALATLSAPAGTFSLVVYAGPQEYRRLTAVGHNLDDVNPYGWSVFRIIIQPASVLVMKILLWMHQYLLLGYGWVIILFGIAVRMALWPLNQKAMRSGLAMQAIQPEMKAIQERYKKDPQKLQQEMMKLYREHGVNPLGGCLPMLIPMPVLFAVWFVLANTIEFRGVPFLWLPDLARHDPFYIIPVVSGILMFAVSKIGQKGMPPNPQATMMTYTMPIMMTVLFLNLASGVSLYYAVQNIPGILQQWMISKERRKRALKPAKT